MVVHLSPEYVVVLPDTLALETPIDELEEVEGCVFVAETDDNPPWPPEVYDEEDVNVVTELPARPVTAKMARHVMGRASERPNSFMVVGGGCCGLCR